jgi:hypothetical protein
VGCFGASTGAAAALIAAAARPDRVAAVVSRGGRPDLAGPALAHVTAPALLIVGGNDPQVIELNRRAQALLRGESRLEIVPGAGHLFEEPGALEHVAGLTRDWFVRHLAGDEPRARRPLGRRRPIAEHRAVEHEHRGRQVRLDVVAAHERLDAAAGQPLDRRNLFGPHRLLEQPAHQQHVLLPPAGGQPALDRGQGLLHHDDDHVVAEKRMRARRTPSERSLAAAHHRVDDLLVEPPAGESVLAFVH